MQVCSVRVSQVHMCMEKSSDLCNHKIGVVLEGNCYGLGAAKTSTCAVQTCGFLTVGS